MSSRALLALLLLAAGCTSGDLSWSGAPTGEPTLQPRRQRHPGGALAAEWTALVWPDGRELKHGLERRWYEDGALASERAFERGEPTGAWRSWHASGALRSEQVFAGADGRGELAWWHADGSLAARGETIGDAKSGAWSYWHASGALAEHGSYASGRRQGVWSAWWEDGAPRSRGVLADDVRVGPWTEWDRDGVPQRLAAVHPVGEPFELAFPGDGAVRARCGRFLLARAPSADELRALARNGVALVVDLAPRGAARAFDARALCAELDVERLELAGELDRAATDRVLARLPESGAVLVASPDGARAGAWWEAYRRDVVGIPAEDARAEGLLVAAGRADSASPETPSD